MCSVCRRLIFAGHCPLVTKLDIINIILDILVITLDCILLITCWMPSLICYICPVCPLTHDSEWGVCKSTTMQGPQNVKTPTPSICKGIWMPSSNYKIIPSCLTQEGVVSGGLIDNDGARRTLAGESTPDVTVSKILALHVLQLHATTNTGPL